MENEVLVKVEQLSKKFSKDLKSSLWYGVKDLFTSIGGDKKERTLRKDEFWALKDISFQLKRGECIGLIGHNGAGKSTLLKILNGLINPDEGKVTIKGRVGALIELGAGFNPILTGRENIYNNGAVLGFSKKEIDEKLEEIIAFSELQEFIDMPVQNYSSGMKVRLGFAIASQMEPDVLIIDEVLAVGDLGFVLKCFKTIDRILPHTAIVFVSHNMPMISRICNKVILLEKGVSKFNHNDVAKGIDLYYSYFSTNDNNTVFDDGQLELIEFDIINNYSEINNIKLIEWDGEFSVYFKFKTKNNNVYFQFFIIITDKEQRPVALLNPNREDLSVNKATNIMEFSVTHQNCQLSKGFYNVTLAVRNSKNKEPILRINDILSFQVSHQDEVWEPFLLKANFNNVENFKIEK